MLSLSEIHRAAQALETLLPGARLQRILQPDDLRLELGFYCRGEMSILCVCCRHPFARIGLRSALSPALPAPPAFSQYLRSHCLNSEVERVSVSSDDRKLGIRLSGAEGSFELVLSIMGARSNLYLLDGNGMVLYSMRPLGETRRDLKLGEAWTDPEGRPKSAGIDRWPDATGAAYLIAVEECYSRLESRAASEALARKLESVLSKEAEALARKFSNLQQDLNQAIEAETLRRQGELLKSALHGIHRGDRQVTARDFESGTMHVIDLDPSLSPAENLAVYFKRYQKELRGGRLIGEQQAKIQKSREEIEQFRSRLAAIASGPVPDDSALQELASHSRIHKLLIRSYPDRRPTVIKPATPAGRKEVPARMRPKRFKTDQGFEIWVGKSEEGNDYLTTRLARGNDLFFHLEGYPGSHVILRTEGRTDPPSEAILDACELAVHFSKQKEAKQADVHMAAVKNVKKPKGAKPGLVYVAGGKSIRIRRNAARLENILSARIDE
jgi:predicted ribosome quality control (RQC) complex YloA/Tae2 family protein